MARSPAHNRTYLVAVVVTEFTGYTRARALVGTEAEAQQQRYNVFFAVFAHSDLLARGCMQVLKDRGVKIPQDVGVIGFDDISIPQFVDPPLTSVHQPFFKVG